MPNVLITGGARGIGRAIAKRFADGGYDVVAPSRAELDLRDLAAVDAYAAALENVAIDTLVNNAGINRPAELGSIELGEWREHADVNLGAALLLTRSVGARMAEKGTGRIVNISSIYGTLSRERRAMYSTTKAAVEGLTRAAAVELGPRGVLVNAVCPGFVDSELTRANNTSAQIAAFEAAIPLRRLATIDEIADLVYYFGSKSNSYVTGQSILIDGGFACQ